MPPSAGVGSLLQRRLCLLRTSGLSRWRVAAPRRAQLLLRTYTQAEYYTFSLCGRPLPVITSVLFDYYHGDDVLVPTLLGVGGMMRRLCRVEYLGSLVRWGVNTYHIPQGPERQAIPCGRAEREEDWGVGMAVRRMPDGTWFTARWTPVTIITAQYLTLCIRRPYLMCAL